MTIIKWCNIKHRFPAHIRSASASADAARNGLGMLI